MPTPVVTVSDIQSIGILVGDRLGFTIADVEYQRLKQTINLALERLELSCVADYRVLLEKNPIDSAVWQQIIIALANTESYFFREWGQFDLLRSHILPELIQRRSPEKRLALWSAGCATGEEAYSLAILLTELIPDIETWQITIFGTDINTEALAIATQGEYGAWSLRRQSNVVNKYCLMSDTGSQRIKSEVRQLVKFMPLNLLESCLPDFLQNIDVILCRHVFLHFENEAIAKVLAHFRQALKVDGYLLTGHSELYGVPSQDFRADIFAGSMIYRPQREPARKPPVTSLPRLQRRSPQLSQRQLYLSDPMFDLDQAI
ncbi:CheR family methyltransferase [[Limnothrix rosea] IAM M-220]|uniref:CheR family methyltransferase n=1 Tax=[Limnothrix rosea] IAM M-220 TaxID=454133 RepID=UPI00096649B3|nr:protein-glutamate O-methyltransferase CheR [[Limnothrix rosea] IAM M-220]OKH17446.1 hypothetical protein NIES208_09535 [[Limnothrix rosea] IAM M-220]